MTDIQASIGREHLKRLPEMLQRRRFLVERYRKLLTAIPGIGLPEEPSWARSNWQSYCIRLPDRLEQYQVMQFMLDREIATRRGVMCAHWNLPMPIIAGLVVWVRRIVTVPPERVND